MAMNGINGINSDLQRDETVVRKSINDAYAGEQGQSHVQTQQKQANNHNVKQSAALSMVEHF